MRFVRIVASLSALSLGIAGTSVAAESSGQGADTTSSATAQKAYQAIAGVDRKLTEAAADVPASTSGADALKTTQRGVGVTIPTDPRSDVTIAGRNGAVSVTLPRRTPEPSPSTTRTARPRLRSHAATAARRSIP